MSNPSHLRARRRQPRPPLRAGRPSSETKAREGGDLLPIAHFLLHPNFNSSGVSTVQLLRHTQEMDLLLPGDHLPDLLLPATRGSVPNLQAAAH